MAYNADRVLETSTTTGTGNFTIAGAVAGFRTFASAYAVGDIFPYAIEAVDASGNPTGEYECGNGTLLTSSTFSRDHIDTSSNAGALVNFSAGTKYVYVAQNADDIININRSWAAAIGMLLP